MMGPPGIRNSRGSVLVLSIWVCLVVSILTFVLHSLGMNERLMAERQRKRVIAFHIAEAGIERAIYTLRQDYLNGSNWTDGLVIGSDTISLTDSYQRLPYPGCSDSQGTYVGCSLNNGMYSVYLKNGNGSQEIWIKSTGEFDHMEQTIEVYGCLEVLSIWNNAIYAGSGQQGGVIHGNVDVRGSVHVLGDSLQSSDLAIALDGTATLAGNNYYKMEADLKAKVPALETVSFGNEKVQTLHSKFRVKHGKVDLGGNGTVANKDDPGNNLKETTDGVFVNDGFVEHSGLTNVHTDITDQYDLGEMLLFPKLDDLYPEGSTTKYRDYFQEGALVINSSTVLDGTVLPALAQLNAIYPESNFTISQGDNKIHVDGNGNMTVSGRIYVEGPLNFMLQPNGKKSIEYNGTATILATGNVVIDVGLKTPDPATSGASTFPSNILGVMTPLNITLGEGAQRDVMGLFYAENTISLSFQTNVVGTIVANYFDMGDQVPKIYQVPQTLNHLPPRLIGSDPYYFFKIVSWQKI